MMRGEAGLPRRVTPVGGPGTRVRVYIQTLHTSGARQQLFVQRWQNKGPGPRVRMYMQRLRTSEWFSKVSSVADTAYKRYKKLLFITAGPMKLQEPHKLRS